MLPAEIKLHPDEKFLQHAKIEPPCFAGQIKRAKVSTQLYRAMLWWSRIDVHKKRPELLLHRTMTSLQLVSERKKKKSQPVAKIRFLLHER